MRALALVALAPALALATPLAAASVRKPITNPVVRDWTFVTTRLPSGTFVQGNPQAKVKLVEYLSLTCPHCAHMEEVAIPPLTRDYIRTGKVSYEVRIALRDPLDLVAALLARCSGPRGFFAALPPLYAAQQGWAEKGFTWLQSSPPTEGKSNGQLFAALAHEAGLDAFFTAHGLAVPRQNACLADAKETALLSDMAKAIWTPSFGGTPTFEINGKSLGTLASWDELKAKLVAAGA